MQPIYLYPRFLTLLVIAAVMAACNMSGGSSHHPSPPHYDLNHPVVTKLSDRLNEISGLAYYAKDSSIFAIVDEAGILYKLIPGEKVQLQHWKFSKTSDYEDIVLLDSVFYVLKSKGDVVAFKLVTPDSIVAKEYNIPLNGKNEFEILYYDDQLKKLVLICKNCKADNKDAVGSFSFDPQLKAFDSGPVKILSAPILARSKMDEKRFKPSAAAIHPLTGELYIISSINKCLVIADRNGQVKEVYPLDPKLYKQPEGITFSPSGDMFISNEAAGEGLPNLVYYKYKKLAHEK